MKTVIFLVVVAAFAACHSPKELQVQMVNAELIRIDTVRRYYEDYTRQILTWKDDRGLEYVSYEPMQYSFSVGTRMFVLRTR